MKQVWLLAVAFLSLARFGGAAPCVSEMLADYLALGASGCTFSGSTFSNFQVLSGINFATAISPTAVTITPTGDSSDPGLTISTKQTASGGTPLEAILTYDISGPLYEGVSAALSGSSETVDGGVTGLVNYCEGGKFGPDGLDGCAFANGGLLTLDGIQNSDMGAFASVSFLNVTDDLTIDPGTAGTASAGSLTNSFTTAVPEPVSTALAGLGLAWMAVYRLRVRRVNQQMNQEEN